MKKSRCTETQVVAILVEADAGMKVAGCVPQARHQPTNLLQLEEQVWRDERLRTEAHQGTRSGALQVQAHGCGSRHGEQCAEEVDQKKITIKLGDFIVAEKGKISENYNEEKLKEYMEWDSILITIDLKQGKEEYECYTCDFTHDYIDINAHYRRS